MEKKKAQISWNKLEREYKTLYEENSNFPEKQL